MRTRRLGPADAQTSSIALRVSVDGWTSAKQSFAALAPSATSSASPSTPLREGKRAVASVER